MNKAVFPSVVVLILSNLFPVYMVLKNNWSLSDILLLYWSESGIIGFFKILKMIFGWT